MTDTRVITALVADDEDDPRSQLVQALKTAWPGLVLIEAVNGADAWDAVLEHAPALCFLDVRMPGLTGFDVAQRVGPSAHVVFVATPSDLALRSIEEAGIDHLRKPVDPASVAALVARIRPRIDQPPRDLGELLGRLAGQMRRRAPLEVVRTGIGRDTQDVRVDDVAYFETDGRHTRVVGRASVGLIRTSIKDLVGQLDPAAFVQIDRQVLVNRSFIARLDDDPSGGLRVSLAGLPQQLVVASRFHASVRAGMAG